MLPDAPIVDFKLPQFAENGYTRWVLEGARGIYESEEQATIVDMMLRVYTGDERMAVEMTLRSPLAVVRLQENAANSDKAIYIEGRNFAVSGAGWKWDGESRRVQVFRDVVVRFNREVGGILQREPATAGGQAAPAETTIESESLDLETSETAYRFTFTGDVRVASRDMRLTSERFFVDTDAPEGEGGIATSAPSTIDAVNRFLASGSVVMTQPGRVARCREAEFLPAENLAVLRGGPRIEVAGALVTGEVVRIRDGRVEIRGGESARARMTLSNTGGLGIMEGAELGDETTIVAQTILLQRTADGNRFDFEGDVTVRSGDLSVTCGNLAVVSVPAEAGAETPEIVRIGSVESIVAEDTVRIRRGGELASAERAEFLPLENRAVLTGDPEVRNGRVRVVAESLELLPGGALAEGGEGERRVRVELPELPDLGYRIGFDDASEERTYAPPEAVGTTIRSRTVRMRELPGKTLFQFIDEVAVSATNLSAECARMNVSALSQGPNPAGPGRDLEVAEIEGLGSVRIEQQGRTATAGRIVVKPVEGKVYLEDAPVVSDGSGRVEGYRIVLNQGERKAVIEGDPEAGERARIQLNAFEGFEGLEGFGN